MTRHQKGTQVQTYGIDIFCFDCGAKLTDRNDWEPMLVGVGEGMRNVIAAYRARRKPTHVHVHVHIDHAPICFDCLDLYQAIDHVKFHETDNDVSRNDTIRRCSV